jgi:hypothetical protein
MNRAFSQGFSILNRVKNISISFKGLGNKGQHGNLPELGLSYLNPSKPLKFSIKIEQQEFL